MLLDRSYIERNRVSTNRIRQLASRLTGAELQQRIGEHWTVAIALAHLAFWDRRVLLVLDATEQAGKLVIPPIDFAVNDVALPFWAAVPPRQAAQLAIETAVATDRRLEDFPPALLEELHANSERWLVRALHRNMHLDEIDAVFG